MKLDRLASTTARLSSEAAERARETSTVAVRRVEMAEGIEGDRERSLPQELASVDPRVVGDFAGEERLLEEARAVAAGIAGLGEHAGDLLQAEVLADRLPHLDDNA